MNNLGNNTANVAWHTLLWRFLIKIPAAPISIIKHHAPLTLWKIALAEKLYGVLKLFVKERFLEIKRNGIHYRVDLTEGIDLSLFLFGAFQSQILKSPHYRMKPDAIVIDVGANIGSMSLLFAQSVPRGRVYTFEPTHYAFHKLQANLERNPLLAHRVVAVNKFVTDRVSDKPGLHVCSSWKLSGDASPRHALHGGIVKSSENVPSTTLDDFVAENNLNQVDLIKIDTDGYEYEVLNGARRSIECFRPYIIFEVGTYLLSERQMTFMMFLDFFESVEYRLRDIQNGVIINRINFKSRIPLRTTIDVLAFPDR